MVWRFALLLGVLAWTATPAPATACTFVGGSAELVWPRPDETDVAVDATLVVHLFLLEGTFFLEGPKGERIELKQVLQLPRFPDAWVFLRAPSLLSPNTRYRLHLELSNPQVNEGWPVPALTFSTGERNQRAASMPSPSFEYTRGTEDCGTEGCPAVADVAASFDLPVSNGGRPRWLVLWNEAEPVDADPIGWERLADGDSLANAQGALRSSADCVRIAVVDVTGLALAEDRRCKPDRCAHTQLVPTTDSCDYGMHFTLTPTPCASLAPDAHDLPGGDRPEGVEPDGGQAAQAGSGGSPPAGTHRDDSPAASEDGNVEPAVPVQPTPSSPPPATATACHTAIGRTPDSIPPVALLALLAAWTRTRGMRRSRRPQ